jgi:hypothetical protein
MTRAGELCYSVRMTTRNASDIISAAFTLKFELELWTPNEAFVTQCRVQVSTTDAQYVMDTAEAYRYATILYLQQAVPEITITGMKGLVQVTISHLSSVPPCSAISLVHIYPLFIAGCEASNEEERQWVKERWEVMIARMRVKNVSKCWEITQEVWKRRDAYRQARNEDRAVYDLESGVGSIEDDVEESDLEFLAGGRLHWASVMNDLGWEISF